MTQVRTAQQNPYVGPRAFLPGETLYGRETELNNLLDLFIAERIVLLYSPSGAGKTSLIHAGLIPQLKRDGFRVRLPVIRVNAELPEGVASSAPTTNRYVYSALSSLEEGAATSNGQLSTEQLARLSLEGYLDTRPPAEGQGENEVLIFDQFEEILTLDPTDLAAKEAFFSQVGSVLRDRARWALFAMREDYVASLDPYLSLIPTRFATTFRLDLLGTDAARQAVQFPARDAGVTFSDEAAKRVVDDLRRVRVQRPGGSVEELGPHIEPVQLQVVCRQLWDRPRPDPAAVTEEDVVQLGNVDSALADYYVERVATIAEETKTSERSIRDWFDTELITEQGFRTQVLQGPDGQDGDRSEAVKLLRDAHLVRAEKRRGAMWYELAHDRLIEPIQTSNKAWRNEHLSTLERQAALWDSKDRPEGLLLWNEALVEAERWAAARAEPLPSVEADFLAACQRARTAAQRERRSARRFQGLAVAAVIVSVVALAAFAWALRTKSQARTDQVNATRRQLAAHVFSKLGERLDRSLLLDVEALRGAPVAETRSALLTDLQRAPQLSTFLHSPRALINVAVRPDGKLVAAGRDDGQIELWDVDSRRALDPPLKGHGALVGGLAISRDGRLLASASDDKTVKLWNLESRQLLATLEGHSDLATSVAISPDGRVLASGGVEGTVIVWDVARRQAVATLTGHDGVVTTVGFSPDGRTLASGSNDRGVILWDVASGQQITTLVGHGGAVRTVAFSPDGSTLASSGNDKTVILWDVAGQQRAATLTGHAEFVRSVAFSPNGKMLASGSEDGTVKLWDPETGTAFDRSLVAHRDLVTGVAFGPDSRTLASSSIDHSVILWDVVRENPLGETLGQHSEGITSVTFSPDGRTLAAGSLDRTISLWEARSGRRIATLAPEAGAVSSVAFSSDGRTLAAGTAAGSVVLFNVGSHQRLATLAGHTDRVTTVAFNPDGRTVASGGADGRVIVWDAQSHQQRATLTVDGAAGAVSDVAFKPGGGILAAATDGGAIFLWDPSNGRPLGTLPSANGAVRDVAFRPDGLLLASAGEDGTILLWDPVARERRDLPLAGHGGPVTGVAFSQDNRTLVSSSEDGTVLLWDVDWYARTRLPLGQPVTHHRGVVTAVAVGDRGTLLASAGEDGAVVRWDVDANSWKRRACFIANRNLIESEEWDSFVGPGRKYRRTCPEFPAT